MAVPYKPLKIDGNVTGLVQNRQNFIIPQDAYPVLENAYIFRNQIRRKQGAIKLGRLMRAFEDYGFDNTTMATSYSLNLLTINGYITNADNANPGQITTDYPHDLSNGDVVYISQIAGATGYNDTSYTITVVDDLNFTVGVDAAAFGAYTSGGVFTSNRSLSALEPNASIVPGSVEVTISAPDDATFSDATTEDGTFVTTGVGDAANSSIDYITGDLVLELTAATGGATITVSYNYYPALPVMGARIRELNNTNNEQTVFFDTRYAYRFSGGFMEFLPGTVWSGNDSDFFWSTNFFTLNNLKLFWVTNFSGTGGDPIRYTDGATWFDFGASATVGQVDAAGNYLNQCLAMLPFRGRLVTFNTYEGTTLAGSVNYPNRIRWAAIGNPLTTDAWRDDIPGQGGFLNIPTSQSIIAVGFVRDNLVVYCERSTWQLRYTGLAVAPFQIEKINTVLGAESTFSAINFDTSLVGIGDKGIVECDSFSSKTIDDKIPDLVFDDFNNQNEGTKRVHGIRNYPQRLAYWTYPTASPNSAYPNRRLVLNVEDSSWAIFTDSYTVLGTYQAQSARTWAQSTMTWAEANFTWLNKPALFPDIVGGNQQGYVMILDSQVTNDPSLQITAIAGNDPNVTVITSPSHNLQTGQVIGIVNIIAGTDFEDLNEQVFQIVRLDDDTFEIYSYNSETDAFSDANIHATGSYIGGGEIRVRDNFSVVSKKFNMMDTGKSLQIGYVDILCSTTSEGAFSLYAYRNYNDNEPMNTFPQNSVQQGISPPVFKTDNVFNTIVPTSVTTLQQSDTSKMWQRVICPIRGNFITLQYTLSPAQMAGREQENNIQIDAQVIWLRQAGRMSF